MGPALHAVITFHEPLQCYRYNRFGDLSKNCDKSGEVCRRCSEAPTYW